MSVAKQLALALVKETVAQKKLSCIMPDYALRTEIIGKLDEALDSLAADREIILRIASVNKMPAYELPLPAAST